MARTEHAPGAAFPGVIGLTADRPGPAWPAPLRARTDAPNVLLSIKKSKAVLGPAIARSQGTEKA